MPTFFEKLNQRARTIDSLLCVGLDPHPEELPEQTAEAAEAFCIRLINATQEYALAFKPNAAFFEVLGPEGWAALHRVIKAVPEGIPVILDAKRGDISSTAQAYARSAFEVLGADAITLSPYMGYDSLSPFLTDPEKGIFLLCKTSNPGSVDLQDLPLGGHYRLMTVYEKVAGLAHEWGANCCLGLVVGATFPEALQRVRQFAPDQWILSPGLGAQGADLKEAMRAGLRADGLGLLINVSRSISRAQDPRQAARALVESFREAQLEINQPLPARESQTPPLIASLVEGLLSMGCIQFGEFTLKSGLVSPIYIDLRRLVTFPGWMTQVAAVYIQQLSQLEFDRIAGLPYAALPIATAISLQGNYPLIYPRKDVKDYGTGVAIEGIYHPGETVVVIDDLATTGGSKFEAIEKLAEAGLNVRDVVVLIDRESGAREALAEAGYRMHALLTLSQLLDHWDETQRLPANQIASVRAFLQETGASG
ncbi:MAG TPA: orotidine-5'-phosphate decarboxylase [Brevefilum sp.]|nr:orotidine-5'-phosphate decarboxylase [Brevefilum sp.]HOR19567.1 orotidine-5'-phosphate decarboxylase [Brevefilum sp.]HPL68719.1 orotidine-5'-phosphate decarboxylase [Brevefilum sp.]